MSKPHGLLELYLSYKASTKLALQWLWSTSPLSQQKSVNRHFSNSAEIVKAASDVRSRSDNVPPYVISALKDAIAKRWEVYNLYSNLKDALDGSATTAGNESHRAFIKRLEQALQLLTPLQKTLAKNSGPLPVQENPETSVSPIQNRFASLAILDDDKEVLKREQPTAHIEKFTTTEPPYIPEAIHMDLLLEDDDLGEHIEISFYVYELEAIVDRVNGYFREAAEGTLPLVFASWLATTAYHAVERIAQRVSSIVPDHETLIKKWIHDRKPVIIRFKDIPELRSDFDRFSAGVALWFHHRLVNDCRTGDEYRTILSNAGQRNVPHELIYSPIMLSGTVDSVRLELELSHMDDLAMDRMQESMRQLLATKRAIAQLELPVRPESVCEPLLPTLDAVLKDNDAPIPTHLVVGMEMLLSTYRAFIWPTGTPNKQNPRIMALRFAQEVRQGVQKGRDALQALSNGGLTQVGEELLHLMTFQDNLEAYTKEQRFDLYYQAPWTAGCHMVEILHHTMEIGLGLCFKQGFVSAVLHLYNALRKTDSEMRRIDLLEDLCDIFLESLFLKSKPEANFSSSFRRAMGARLTQDRDALTNATRVFPRLHPLAVENAATPSQASLFYDLHNHYYATTLDFWCKVYGGAHTHCRKREQVEQRVHSAPFNVPLDMIKNAAILEFIGPRPIARVNYFAIYALCIEILDRIGKATVADTKCGALTGFFIVDELLEAIVEHLKDDRKKILLPYLRPLKTCIEALHSADENLSLSQYLWKL